MFSMFTCHVLRNLNCEFLEKWAAAVSVVCSHCHAKHVNKRIPIANLHQENTLGGTVSQRGTQVSVFDSYWMLFGSKRCSTKGPLQPCSVPLLEDPCLLTPVITNHN